jgi:hypothetical protein
MKKEYKSARCSDNADSAQDGALYGIVAASLHQINHVITNRIPDNIPVHMLGEVAAFAVGGVVLFAAASAIRNFLTRTK